MRTLSRDAVIVPASLLALSLGIAGDSRVQAIDARTQTLMSRRPAAEQNGVSPSSPLAANHLWLFALASDDVTVLRQSLADDGPWRPMPGVSGVTRVTGLAATDKILYIADGPQHVIVGVDLVSGAVSPYAKLPEAYVPGNMAFADALYFSDAVTARIYRLTREQIVPVAPVAERESRSPKFLASNGDVLVVSSPDDGTVWQTNPPKLGSATTWSAVQRPSPEVQGPSLPRSADIIVPQQVSFPLRPTALAVQGGVVYVIDGNTRGIFAYSRFWPRPVRLTFGPRPVGRPTRLVATSDQLIVLDGERGVTVRWPRFVPTRISCSLTNSPEVSTSTPCATTQYSALAAVFAFLHEQQLLPTKTLPSTSDFATTVRHAGYATVTMARAMTSIACAMNRTLCGPDGEVVTSGRSATVPDVYAESYVDVGQVRLTGERTLGQVADAAVPSPEFLTYSSEFKLSELNGAAGAAPQRGLRQASTGVLSVPVELVRFVVGIPAEQLRTMAERFKDVTFVPLEESAARRAAASSGGQTATFDDVAMAYRKMRQNIGGTFDVGAPDLSYLGIAEHDIDTDNPDLADALGAAMAPVRSAASATTPTSDAPDFVIRDFKEDDHGTAVASLIAARPTTFVGPSLAAGALLLPINDAEPWIGDSIRQAYVNQRVRIFNLSFHFGKNKRPPTLEAAVKQYPDALFVVAAGNDTVTGPDGQVCVAFDAFPVCWGDKPNVLVVTATDLDGRTLLQPDTAVDPIIPGANWNPTIVHVAAPGDGFYASGRGHSYVKVSGSSFATPLVTATAALLYAQNVRSPWDIKQRIITTADPVAGLDGRVVAGRLNAKRAATNLSFALVVDDLHKETVIALHESGVSIGFQTTTENLNVPLSNVRRLTRLGGGKWRLVFVDKDRLRQEQVQEQHWPFRYFELDAQKHRRSSNAKAGDLSNYTDYVGPIL